MSLNRRVDRLRPQLQILLPSKVDGTVRRTLEKRERFITLAKSLRRRGGRLSRMACACEAGLREKRNCWQY
jgi:hypothetical protein